LQKTESMPGQRLRILFLCTGNTCRSQMAEGLTNFLRGDEYEAASAGVKPGKIDPRAVKVMAEMGIDISGQSSKDVSELMDQEWDIVVTLCGQARESCPLFPGKAKRVHMGFEDPPHLAADAQSEEEALVHYRRIRDEIRAMVEKLPDSLDTERELG